MIRAGLLAALLAGPAGAEGLAGQALCAAAWGKMSEMASNLGDLSAAGVTLNGDWCVVEDSGLDLPGDYSPNLKADTLRFRGSAVMSALDKEPLPLSLEVEARGVRLVTETGDAQLDWLFAAQARPNPMSADLALNWDPGAHVLTLDWLSVDFPLDNRVKLTGEVSGVDFSSVGAMQMSATSFAIQKVDLRIHTHGLFEWFVLMPLGPIVLPREGDMDMAAERIRADLLAMADALPGSSFPEASKAALVTLIGELPNPSGELTLAMWAEPGIGPVRFGGFAITGMPRTFAEASPLFQGVTVDIGWTHVDAP